MQRRWLIILLLLIRGSTAGAEVTVYLKNGQRLIGESIVKDDDQAVEVKVCRSFSRTIPKTAIDRYTDVPATQPVNITPATQPVPPAQWSVEDDARIEKLIGDYFASDERRSAAMAALRLDPALPRDEVARLSRLAFVRAREGLKLAEGDSVFGDWRYNGNIHVELYRDGVKSDAARHATSSTSPAATRDAAGPTTAAPRELAVPATAPAATRKLAGPTTAPAGPFALVVLLHGGGEGDGDWRAGAGMFIGPFRAKLPNVIFLCPTVLAKHYAEWAGNPAEEAYVKELIKAAKRTWPIDTDRIYCAGYSMGGYGTWHYGGHQADLFAGLVSGAGGILLGTRQDETWGWGILSNLAHTPIQFLHAKDDVPAPVWSDQASDRILSELAQDLPSGYVHKYVEYDKGGHGGAVGGVSDAVKWAAAFQREPYPKRVVWEPSRLFIRNFYWLHVDKPRFFTRLEGSIDGNTINLKLIGIGSGFSILLNEHLVDMEKPVIVRVEGRKVFEGIVQPSLSAMLESIDDKIDPGMWFWGRIDF